VASIVEIFNNKLYVASGSVNGHFEGYWANNPGAVERLRAGVSRRCTYTFVTCA
jgi:hypothetical protein